MSKKRKLEAEAEVAEAQNIHRFQEPTGSGCRSGSESGSGSSRSGKKNSPLPDTLGRSGCPQSSSGFPARPKNSDFNLESIETRSTDQSRVRSVN